MFRFLNGITLFSSQRAYSRVWLVATLAMGAVAPHNANAHFVWLARCDDQQQEVAATDKADKLEVFFGESAEPDDPDLLKRLDGMKLYRVGGDGKVEQVTPSLEDQSLSLSMSASDQDALFVATHDLGVRDKGDGAFRLIYHAKTGPSVDSSIWQTSATSKFLALDVTPSIKHGSVQLLVQVDGKPIADAEVVVLDTMSKESKGATDDEGHYAFATDKPGRYAVRVRHIVPTAGKIGETAYDSVRHYTTLTLDVPPSLVPVAADASYQPADLPVTLTSFGGAVIDNDVYVYGGTMGGSHDYSRDVQNGALMKSTLKTGEPSEWQTVSEGPKLQGLALIPHGDNLIRIGGFEARNAKGEEDDLWSVDSVASFDTKTNKWTDLPALPEPRSSFDAAIIDDTVYVIGGWGMAGDARRVWHKTAWKMDLSADQPTWTAIAEPPFERRAIAVAAHDGKIYAIGGITSGDDTVRETDVYDPSKDQWTQGPELVGNEGITGFGASAFAVGDDLYVTTVSGSLQKLSSDGSSWQIVATTPTARFFHRMLPLDSKRFVVVGGSNMSVGRFKATEVIQVP